MNRKTLSWVALSWLLACGIAPAWAHKPSDSYVALALSDGRLTGRWDIALRDLDLALDLDRNRDDRIDWGEVRTRLPEIDAYALAHLSVSGVAPCPLTVADHAIDRHSDGAYAVLRLAGPCAANGELEVGYDFLFDVDAQHRGLLKLEVLDGAQPRTITAVFPAQQRRQTFETAAPSAWRQFADYLRDGVVHIAAGYDHLLFLVALLLPSVLGGRDGTWQPLPRVSQAAGNVVKTFTAFTLAHSLTLSVAALGLVQLPSRLTESLIALSVLLTALDNLVPFLPPRRWVVAFVFGLVHGFGFASVLGGLDLPRGALALALAGFNVGVEIGQLVLVAIFVPIAYAARRTLAYQPVALRGGSVAIAVLAVGWLAERSLDVQLMPF